MKKKVRKQLKRAKKWWKKTTWFGKIVALFQFVYKLNKVVGWLKGVAPTVWPIVEECLKNLP